MCDGSLITKGHFVKELGIELSTARRVVWLPRMTGDVVDPGVLPGIRVGRLRLLARGGMAWRMVVSRFRWIGGWSWPMTIAVAFIYTGCFASFISRHTSLPFWDGYVYVQKTWDLASKFDRSSVSRRLNPALYLRGSQPERPPLLIAAAAIALGPNPGNAAIAYVWLTIRVGVILLALYLLSREFRTTRFVPAAALVIFGSPLMCNFYRLYFMDEPFAAFGLLGFALILIDDRHRTMGSAAAASMGILALFLVKPVAPAFVFPWCVIRGVRALRPLRQDWPGIKQHARPLILWAIPYLLLLTVMLSLIYASPYGPGIRQQYKLGATGYWHQDIGATAAFQLFAFVLPPWLLLALLVSFPFFRRLKLKAVLLYLLAGLLWWVLFSYFLTYTVEDRLLGQAMPYVATAVLLWVCQRPTVALVVTVVAGFFFFSNTLIATGRITPRHHRSIVSKLARFLSPRPGYQQPVPEVGLLPFASQLNAAINPSKATTARGVFSDLYVEPNPLNMSLRISTRPQRVFVRGVLKAPQDFDVGRFCQEQWFITKTRRQNPGVTSTGLWTAMNCVHALITDNQSPLHSYFERVLEAPIHQPDIEDSLVLWHLASTPPAEAIIDSLRWLKPRLTNDPPAFKAVIDAQIGILSTAISDTSKN